jgi:hypothetical protein
MKREILKDLQERTRLEVKAGTATKTEILADLTEIMKYDYELSSKDLVEAKAKMKEYVTKLLEQHKKEQADFPEVTDCDRLDAAFVDLEQQGVLTAQNAGYTQSDGFDVISEKYSRLTKKQQKASVGFVFFHQQDLERVLEGKKLLLAFGAGHGDSKQDVEAGKLIQKVLTAHGFKVKWNGKSDTRLEISKFIWQKRR